MNISHDKKPSDFSPTSCNIQPLARVLAIDAQSPNATIRKKKKKKNFKNPTPFFPRPIDSHQKKGFPLFPQILTWWQGNPSEPKVCVLMETWGGLAPNFGFLLETNPRIFCQMCFLSWVIYYGRIRKQSPNNTNNSKIWNRFSGTHWKMNILNPKPFGLVQIIFLFKQVTFRFSTWIFQGCHPKWLLHPSVSHSLPNHRLVFSKTNGHCAWSFARVLRDANRCQEITHWSRWPGGFVILDDASTAGSWGEDLGFTTCWWCWEKHGPIWEVREI